MHSQEDFGTGCNITEFEAFHAVSIQGGGSASFASCVFANNTILEDWTGLGLGFGVVHASVRDFSSTDDASAQARTLHSLSHILSLIHI